ncbi:MULTISPECIES: HlyD family secretion protein [Comamonas]|uniref:HlyD family secretion protein n=3 Tax=Comamonas TaxID=283 RepID=A0ABR8SCC4_9BURK|nr:MULTISPECIES: HlyD family secretion protein [Comamonas]MBD7961121.1 HlyD family secretion protein [Comamonas avium]MBD9400955.1 HlyD family secretion protein [Comamonas sp. CMM02]
MTENASSVSANPVARQQRRNKMLLGLAGVTVVAAAIAGGYWWLHASNFVSTDNAYAAVEVAQVTPSVGGTVLQVLVKDTQAVRQGDVLVRIDPTDAKLSLAQAEAELARAVRRVKGYVANDGGLKAQIAARAADQKSAAAKLTAAQADMARATVDLQRRQALAQSGSVSGDELTHAQNAFAAAQSQLAAALAAQAQALANHEAAIGAKQVNATLIEGSTAEDNPEVLLALARRDQAQVDLDRTTVRAPVDGVVAKRSVQIGQRVQAGTPLMSVVPLQDMYVDANFKEVQLPKVRTGQSVQLHADLYGKDVTYTGTVVGFSGGSGAAFAAIPAQNATGNWIKVVQRLPVRIQLNAQELAEHPLRVGLSMTATVDTRSGPAVQ